MVAISSIETDLCPVQKGVKRRPRRLPGTLLSQFLGGQPSLATCLSTWSSFGLNATGAGAMRAQKEGSNENGISTSMLREQIVCMTECGVECARVAVVVWRTRWSPRGFLFQTKAK